MVIFFFFFFVLPRRAKKNTRQEEEKKRNHSSKIIAPWINGSAVVEKKKIFFSTPRINIAIENNISSIEHGNKRGRIFFFCRSVFLFSEGNYHRWQVNLQQLQQQQRCWGAAADMSAAAAAAAAGEDRLNPRCQRCRLLLLAVWSTKDSNTGSQEGKKTSLNSFIICDGNKNRRLTRPCDHHLSYFTANEYRI